MFRKAEHTIWCVRLKWLKSALQINLHLYYCRYSLPKQSRQGLCCWNGSPLRAYAETSTLETVVLKCIMTMPALLLQKPHQSSKAKDHVICLEHRMKAWYEGDIEQLLHEGYTIQSWFSLVSRQARSEEQLARSFSKLMFEGKVKPAICLHTPPNYVWGNLMPFLFIQWP